VFGREAFAGPVLELEQLEPLEQLGQLELQHQRSEEIAEE